LVTRLVSPWEYWISACEILGDLVQIDRVFLSERRDRGIFCYLENYLVDRTQLDSGLAGVVAIDAQLLEIGIRRREGD
jgi:hypothetical protein